ncbi:MAG: ABC transporter ATP-binding protein [Thermoflexales bacterium]|nr:ABC transporter ATP-binding protein [Thermoflexales bacterium]
MSDPLPSPEIALEMRGITKRFPGVLANDNITFDLRKGEIHALLGENGAGKSTLMNILYGLYHPDQGEVLLSGKSVRIHGPRDAIGLGIGMVHQHFMLVPPLTVAENIVLGMEETRGPLLDSVTPVAKIRKIAAEYGLEIDPDAKISDLSVGLQQRVEIVKTLYRNARVLVLDEPTAVLTPQEVEGLFITLRKLVSEGVSIIFISHKLKEVMAIANRITVLRQGRVVGSTTPAEADEAKLASMMVGRPVLLKVDKGPAQPRDTILSLSHIKALSDRRAQAVNDVSFEVKAGEIVGIAGVEGNGQSELVEVLTGLRTPQSGAVTIGGHAMPNQSPRTVIKAGTSHIPEDRHKYGMIKDFPISVNLVLSTFDGPPFARNGILDDATITKQAERLIQEFDIRTPGPFTKIGSLSGGNQQKVVVAREFSRPMKLLIAAQPTRGVDVGSIEFIHKRIVEARDKGAAVLLVSAELDEIMSLSDRILVMFKGQIVGERVTAQTTRQDIGLLMMGKA